MLDQYGSKLKFLTAFGVYL